MVDPVPGPVTAFLSTLYHISIYSIFLFPVHVPPESSMLEQSHSEYISNELPM